MKTEESRWNDNSTATIVHNPTEEEKKKGTNEMFDNMKNNLKTIKNESESKDKK